MSKKQFNLRDDIGVVRTAINEVISITGSIYALASGNVKKFQNIASGSAGVDLGGYWETIYDASPTSSLSSPLFDLTFGMSSGSSYNVIATTTSSNTEKVKVYRLMAGLLLGDPDGLFTINSTERKEAAFIAFKRNLTKDEIKKGSVRIVINSTAPTQYTASDEGANATFKSDNIGGDYAPLKYNGTGSEVGAVYYNAGIVVLHPDTAWGAVATWSGTKSLINAQYSGNLNQFVDGMRSHTEMLSLHNQVNLQSTVYFCRAYSNEFNYSSNPTFVDDDKRIRVTSGSNVLMSQTYITTVGLYDVNDSLLATGKVNKPIVKSPQNEVILKLRLDY